MSRLIAITNNKGGVGKTHTCFHLAGALLDAGQRILVVDLDPQANLTRLFLDRLERPRLYDVLLDQTPLAEAIQFTPFQGIDAAPADAASNALFQLSRTSLTSSSVSTPRSASARPSLIPTTS